MRHTTVALALTVAVATLAACGAFSSDDEPMPTPTLEGGGGDAGDGGFEAAPIDAPVEAAPPKAFCADRMGSEVVYCNDFDAPAEQSAPFGFATNDLVLGTVSVVADGDRPSVLKVALGPGAGHKLVLLQPINLGNPPGEATYEFDMKVVSSNLSYSTLADIHGAGFSCETSIGLGFFFSNVFGPTRNRQGTNEIAATLGVWHHVSVALHVNPYTEVMTIDGKSVVDLPIAGPGTTDAGTIAECVSMSLRLGIDELGTGDTLVAVILYDNVLVRTGR